MTLAIAQPPETRLATIRRLRTSVVVVTKDQPEKLVNLLRSLCKQSLTADEVIVVDDASTKNYIAAFNGFRDKLPLKTLAQRSAGIAAARNTGIRASSGDLVLFAPDDCEVHTDWIKNLVNAFLQTPGLGIVSGEVLSVHSHATLLDEFCAEETLTPVDRMELGTGPRPSADSRNAMIIGTTLGGRKGYLPRIGAAAFDADATTAGAAVRRESLRRIGNFDLHCTTGADTDLAIRIQEAGYGMWFEPSATLTRFPSQGFQRVLAQWFRSGCDHAYLFHKHFANSRLQVLRGASAGDETRVADLAYLLDIRFPIPGRIRLSILHLMNAAVVATIVLFALGANGLGSAALAIAVASAAFYVAPRFDRYEPIRSALLCVTKYVADCAYMLGGLVGGIQNRIIYVEGTRSRRRPVVIRPAKAPAAKRPLRAKVQRSTDASSLNSGVTGIASFPRRMGAAFARMSAVSRSFRSAPPVARLSRITVSVTNAVRARVAKATTTKV